MQDQNKDVNVTTKNKLFLVDPNPPGRSKIPEEDLFLYISLYAQSTQRGVGESLLQTGEEEGQISFIATQSTQEIYDVSEGPNGTKRTTKKSYATTNYTNMGGSSAQQDSEGMLEGFGINSINIEYGASLVPQVNISFTDLRGASLFDVLPEDQEIADSRLRYGVFFTLPYPVFQLTIKGYYGPPVTYCLHLLKWDSSFDSANGNFNIQAKFVGFQQAFLADMNLGNIIGTVNTQKGLDNLKALKIKQKNEQGEIIELDTPTLDDFLVQMSKLPVTFQNLKDSDTGYDAFIKLTTLQKKMENILTLIGSPMPKEDMITPDSKEFMKKPNNPNEIQTEGIREDDLLLNRDYISVRDLIIMKKSASKSLYFNQYTQQLYGLVSSYEEYLKENTSILKQLKLDIDNIKIVQGVNPFRDFIVESKSFSKGYQWRDNNTGTESKTVNDGKVNVSFKLNSDAETLGVILDNMITEDTPLYNVVTYDINSSFKPTDLITPEVKASLIKELGSPQNPMYVYNFSDMRQLTQNIIDYIQKVRDKEKKEIEKRLNKTLTEELKFNPTLKYVFSVICNNTQAMIKTLYDVSRDSQSESLKKSRNKLFNGRFSLNDLPKETPTVDKGATNNTKQVLTPYPWASVFKQENDNTDPQEFYIGEDLKTKEETNFPEVTFISEFLTKYLEGKSSINQAKSIATKTQNSGADTNDWYPINPIDITDNPYYKLLSVNNKEDFNKKLNETLILRALTILNYSNYKEKSPNYLNFFAELEAYNVEKLLFLFEGSKKTFLKYLQATSQSQTDIDNIVDSLISQGVVIDDGNDLVLNEDGGKNIFKVSDTKISGIRWNDNIKYIVIGTDTKDMINETVTLEESLKKKESFKKINTNPKDRESSPYIFHSPTTYQTLTNICYKAWGKGIEQKIIGGETNFSKLKDGFDIKDISNIDGGANITEKIEKSLPITVADIQERNFINKVTTSAGFEVLTNTKLWSQQSDVYSNALLYLNTLPFMDWDTVIGNEITGSTATILKLPKRYLLWIGGSLYRSNQPTDIINWSGYDDLQKKNTNKNHYLNLQTKTDDFKMKWPLGNILNLPQHTKEQLIQYFIEWVKNGYNSDILKIEKYSEATNEKDIISTSSSVKGLLNETTRVAILVPKIFDDNYGKTKNFMRINKSLFNEFIINFKNKFTQEKTEETETEESKKKDIVKDNKIKLSLYNYLKGIYDKWVAGSTVDTLCYNACGAAGENLIEYFRFIDRTWNDIGDKAVINLKSLTSISHDMDTNIYLLISKILRDNQFLFQILPNYVNFKKEEDVQQMFQPMTNLDEWSSRGPIYVCIYAGGQSKSLAIDQMIRTYAYPNDGFDIMADTTSVPENPNYSESGAVGSDENTMVAFRVAFGAENQSIFKDVSLNQNEYRETGEYFSTLSQLIDKRGGNSKVFSGPNLLKVYRTRSYKCGVEALGCMPIQPLMYFQLDNVPFFNGTYLITNVTHSINGNDMTTNFEGLRQSSNVIPIVDKYTTFLNMNFEEVEDEILPLDNLTQEDLRINEIGVIEELENLPFNFESFLTNDGENLIQLGVTQNVVTKLLEEPLDTTGKQKGKTIFESGIKTVLGDTVSNSQVVMFLSSMLYYSNNMSRMSSSAYNNNVEDWKITGTLKDEDGNDIPKVATNPELKKVFEELYLIDGEIYFTIYTTQSISTPDINNLITTNIQNYIDGKPQEYFDNQILQLPIVENRLKGNDEINEDQEFLKKPLIGKNSEVFKEALYVQDYLFRRRGYLPVTDLPNLDDQKPSIIDFISKNIDTQVTKEYLDKNPNYITNETTGPKICFMFALSSFISKGEYSYGYKHRSKNENNYVTEDYECYSPNFYSKQGGSGDNYSHIINMIMNREVSDVNKKFKPFKKVLRQTNLLSYTNIYPKKDVNKCK
jgi:hypothetical protein